MLSQLRAWLHRWRAPFSPARPPSSDASPADTLARVTAQLEALSRERDQLAQRLHDTETLHRALIEQIPAITYIDEWEAEAHTLYISPQVYTWLGVTPEEWMTGDLPLWLSLIHPADREAARTTLDRGLQTQGNFTYEYRFITRTGQVLWVQDSVTFIPGQGAQPPRMHGVIFDITERKQAEEAQQANEQRYRSFIAQSTEGIWRFELEQPVLTHLPEAKQIEQAYRWAYLAECNQAMAEMYGYASPSAILGAPMRALLPQSDVRHAEYLKAFIRSGYRLTDAETHGPDRLGRPRIFLSNALGIVENGSLLRVWGMQRDVTERRQLELDALELAALYRASAPLAEADDLLHLGTLIAQSVTREFASVDCGILLVNDSGTELRLLTRAGQLSVPEPPPLPLSGPGLTVAAVNSAMPAYAPDVNMDPRYLPGELPIRSELVLPLRVPDSHHPTGYRVIGVLDLHSPEPAAFDERTRRILTVFAERAALALENAQLLERLQAAREAAEQADRLKSEFVANTSHELRTPLAAILGLLGLVLEDAYESPQEAREFVRLTHASAQHLLSIVNEVLDVAKIEAGHVDLQVEIVPVSALLHDVYLFLQPHAEQKQLTFEIESPEVPWSVLADPTKTHQILLNLVGNALKFTEQGQVSLRAWVEGPLNLVHITVRDTGIGIPVEAQGQLFQPFVQADGSTTRRYGGTGLGLHISRRLAELMGGTVTLYSAGINQGTEVTLTLPLAKGDPLTHV